MEKLLLESKKKKDIKDVLGEDRTSKLPCSQKDQCLDL